MNKKILLPIIIAAVAVLLAVLYVFLRGRGVTPPVVPPVAVPVIDRAVTMEDKMNVLQRLSTKTVSVAERKGILQMLMK